jgi:undecaprenyl-diphosphatase
MLGFFYVIVLITYFFFEKVQINYRPVILDEGLEASFPSSHTMLALCVCLSALIMNNYIKFKKNPKKIFNIGIILLMVLIVLSRFLSGVHWFTDIIGGIIISIFLVYIFYISIKKDE